MNNNSTKHPIEMDNFIQSNLQTVKTFSIRLNQTFYVKKKNSNLTTGS